MNDSGCPDCQPWTSVSTSGYICDDCLRRFQDWCERQHEYYRGVYVATWVVGGPRSPSPEVAAHN